MIQDIVDKMHHRLNTSLMSIEGKLSSLDKRIDDTLNDRRTISVDSGRNSRQSNNRQSPLTILRSPTSSSGTQTSNLQNQRVGNICVTPNRRRLQIAKSESMQISAG